MTAGRAIQLTTARTGAKVECGCPQTFNSATMVIGLEHVGGANAGTLVAFDAPIEELGFGQRAGRANQFWVVVGPELPINSQQGNCRDAGNRCDNEAAPGQIR